MRGMHHRGEERTMKRIGITGGIGSGKSVISEIFSCLNIPTYNADNESKRLITTEKSLIKALKGILGDEIYTQEGLNKKKMAQMIFSDKKLLEQVNAIIHPAVIKDFIIWSKSQKSDIVACETAILFESGMDQYVDATITVTAPLDVRIERCKKRDHATEEEIKARIANQMEEDERICKSDYTILNDNKTAILPQIREIIEKILKK